MADLTVSRSPLRPGRRRGLLHLFALRRERRRLADLDERMLKDIGVTPDDALREAGRAIWHVPPNRIF